jgi:hypothetical protein
MRVGVGGGVGSPEQAEGAEIGDGLLEAATAEGDGQGLPGASPMPASSAVTKLSHPAQAGIPGSKASIHGSASHSNSSLSPNHRPASASNVRPSVLKKTLRNSGVRSWLAAARAASRIILSPILRCQIGEAARGGKNAGHADFAKRRPACRPARARRAK